MESAWRVRNNIVGTLALLRAMHVAGVKTIVFSSPAATYRNTVSNLIDENTDKKPTNPSYGWTKLIMGQALRDYGAAYDIRYVALRYFNDHSGVQERSPQIRR